MRATVALSARVQRWLARHTPDWILFHSFEAFFVLACLFAGPQLLLVGPQPGSGDYYLPEWVRILWAWDLTIGGLLVLYGLVRKRLAIEAAGLTLLGVSCLVYALSMALRDGPVAIRLASGVAVVIFAVCCFARRYVIASARDMGRQDRQRRGP